MKYLGGQEEQGFGLLEVLVALVILAMVMMGFLGVLARSSVNTASADKLGYALQLIHNDHRLLRGFDRQMRISYRRTLVQLAARAQGDQAIDSYYKASHAIHINCRSGCSPSRYGEAQAIQTAQLASAQGIIISSAACQSAECWVVYWGASGVVPIDQCTMLQSVSRYQSSGCVLVRGWDE